MNKLNAAMLALLLLLSGAAAGQSAAQDKAAARAQAQARAAARAAALDHEPATEQVLDVNNMTSWVDYDGFLAAIDPFTHGNGVYPKGTETGATFAQGLVWGGKVRDGISSFDSVRVGGSTYTTGLSSGKILRGADGLGVGVDPEADNTHKYHAWRVHKRWPVMNLTSSAQQFYGHVSPTDVTDEERAQLREWYEYDWNNWPADLGAPYEERNGTPGYQPAQWLEAEAVWDGGDFPGYPGADQTIWTVSNDYTNSDVVYGSDPVGLEQQLTVWGYERSADDPLGNVHFYQYRLIYVGYQGEAGRSAADSRIDSMFVVQWADPDVGDAGDDFAASDTTLSLGITYNANPIDAQYQNYGLAPAAVGWDFFQGPIVNKNTPEADTLGLTSFTYFAAGSTISDPDLGEYPGSLQFYNLMRGRQPRPEYPASLPFVNPITDEPDVFTLSGDPVGGTGWLDGTEVPPGDRRVVLTSGPFSMAIGDTVDVVVGQIGAIGRSNIASIATLRYYDRFAQDAYDNGFQVPEPPPIPKVQVSELENQIVLNWGADPVHIAQTEDIVRQGFEFEGYNVYQLPRLDAPVSEGVKLATYDLDNGVSVIEDLVEDPATGFIIRRPVQTGPDLGIQRYYATDFDAIRQQPLANGVEYYYAVTAYSFLPTAGSDAPRRQIESDAGRVVVVPQQAPPGTTDPMAVGATVTIDHTGPGTAPVQVSVIDPTHLTSAGYEIRFAYYDPYEGDYQTSLAPGDTLRNLPEGLYEIEQYGNDNRFGVGSPFPARWALFKGGAQVSDWYPQIDPKGPVPESAAPIIDGFQVYVPFALQDELVMFWENSGRWITWVNWGGSFWNGGADIGANFFGSALTFDQLGSVTLEFAADTTSGPADGWASKGAFYLRHTDDAAAAPAEYQYNGTGYLPFAAYEISNDGSRRQVNVSILENTPACSNLRFDVGLLSGDACTANGNREYVFVHKSDYDEGASYNQDANPFANAGESDIQYAFWPNTRGNAFLAGPFEMGWSIAKTATPADVYAFGTQAQLAGVDSLFEQRIDDINVFPNPYMGFSQLETSRYSKFVTFTHLPETATIRVFNLAGNMVRLIEHTNGEQYERWDLLNQDNIPVASGIYIVHVETDHGDKILKLALVQEEQILQRY